jgi:hypothetical protein
MLKKLSFGLALFLILPFLGVAAVATPPDFTQGDAIPEGANHDWNLGATGARGWMHCEKLTTRDARQIYITEVAEGAPADGILEVGDVVLGVEGEPFSSDARTAFGKALTRAESEAGGGNLSLLRWRDGKTESVVVKLPVLGSYSATAPYDCPKSERILDWGCEVLAERVADPSYRQNPITRSLNALALLASGNPKYLPLVRQEARWASEFSADSFQTWYYGYVIALLAEYQMATGDDSFAPDMRRLALESAEGQSIVGSWGHKFAGPDGRLQGYGMMNAPGLPLTISLILAREAGVDDPEVAEAIEKSARLLRFYIGKGAVPYGDHHPWIQTHEDNGKCGMAAVMFDLMGEPDGAEFFSRMSVASHGPERDTGHTGNFFNILWATPGVMKSGPQATGAWMQEFGAWYFDLARRWDGTFLHQGPPQPRNDKYPGWDCAGTYLLAYAMPRKQIYLTGKRPSTAPRLDSGEAKALIRDGQGWSNIDRNSFYDSLNESQLLARLESWSPVVRERAAMALGRRDGEAPIATLMEMLRTGRIETRYGACQALIQFKGKSSPAIPLLSDSLNADDLWVRVKAAETLGAIGDEAMPTVPKLLTRLAVGPTEEDPRGMEQRYLCFTLFNRRGGMLGRSLEGVDREALYEAVRAGLRNQDGRARGSLGTVYDNLTFEEIRPLLPSIHRAVVEPAPSGIMFADGIRLAGLELLAKNRIKEGMPLCLEIMEIDRWGKRNRIDRCLKALEKYGSAAKTLLPELRQLEKDLLAHREARGLESQIERLRKIIGNIENANEEVELRTLETI